MLRPRELLPHWNIPYLALGGVTLVPRSASAACVHRILAERCKFLGYEGFTLHADGKYQPHLEWSASWSPTSVPSESEIISQLDEASTDVTHYEFVFESDL
ncbi:hypothetical protein [Undibacterium sp. WLHG33]|uniref:hypothetical protein n=1 Tax=Undibacterium sp. WLHG33 TaxID=3412482 RepID=UPI003C30B5EB